MSTLEAIRSAAAETGLALVGAFHPEPSDGLDASVGTLVLLGPGGPEMWQVFSASPEARDRQANPMNRWSVRVIDVLASRLGARALYPFEGPPWLPFQHWAQRGEGAVVSPVRMLATAGRGLWTSYRGALALDTQLELGPTTAGNPCLDCPAPCLTACPVGALNGVGYDVPRCTAHVMSDDGVACRSGCLVRRICPAGQALALPAEQRSFHMEAFLRAQA